MDQEGAGRCDIDRGCAERYDMERVFSEREGVM